MPPFALMNEIFIRNPIIVYACSHSFFVGSYVSVYLSSLSGRFTILTELMIPPVFV